MYYRHKELLGCYFAVKKCEFYLLGNEYALYTDHEPLIYLRTFHNIVKKRFRWIEYLESMNVKVFYIPGKENIVSDFISRNLKEQKAWSVIDVGVVDLDLTNYDMNELLEKQLNDVEIRNVLNYLRDKNNKIEINHNKQKTKWLTRDKLRRCEDGIKYPNITITDKNDKLLQTKNELLESESDSDSSIEQNEHVENIPRQNNVRYGLRRKLCKSIILRR